MWLFMDLTFFLVFCLFVCLPSSGRLTYWHHCSRVAVRSIPVHRKGDIVSLRAGHFVLGDGEVAVTSGPILLVRTCQILQQSVG